MLDFLPNTHVAMYALKDEGASGRVGKRETIDRGRSTADALPPIDAPSTSSRDILHIIDFPVL